MLNSCSRFHLIGLVPLSPEFIIRTDELGSYLSIYFLIKIFNLMQQMTVQYVIKRILQYEYSYMIFLLIKCLIKKRKIIF